MRILVISNEPFNASSSNGRTMQNFLRNRKPEDLAQFYIHGTPDLDFCHHYFQVSDGDALRTFLCGKKKEKHGQPGGAEQSNTPKRTRNCRNLLLRNTVWQSMRWWDGEMDAFLDDFRPEIVLLQAGDAPFMYRIALRIAKKYAAKLVMYNSEHYVLKKRMYSSVTGPSAWHFLLKASLGKWYGRFMDRVDYCIYSTHALEAAYQEAYPHPGKSTALYTTSEMLPLPDCSTQPFSLLYCGNLGVGREYPLDELAKVLKEVDPNARLDIYGTFVDEEAEARVCGNENVVFHGFVDYTEVPRLMSQASMLVHCENRDRLENLQFAFSTKIADSLASKRPFLVYAHGDFPFVRYLKENQCAHIAQNPEQLRDVLKKCIEDREYRYRYVENGVATARKNHSQDSNCQRIQQILEQISQ